MSKLRREPVGQTCPDINRVIDVISAVIKEMDRCDDRDEVSELLSYISSWASDLGSIALGVHSDLEELRSSNAALRDWGQDMYDYASSLEDEINESESMIAELNDKVDNLRDELQDTLEELNTALINGRD